VLFFRYFVVASVDADGEHRRLARKKRREGLAFPWFRFRGFVSVVWFRKERTHHPSVVDVVINDESKKLRTVSLSEPARGERFGVKKKRSAREEMFYRNLALSRAESGTRDLGDAPTHRRAPPASRPGTDKTSTAS
jgi:hypothetical protein